MRIKKTLSMLVSAILTLMACVTALPREASAEEKALDFGGASSQFVEIIPDASTQGWKATVYDGYRPTAPAINSVSGAMTDSLRIYNTQPGPGSSVSMRIRNVGTQASPLLLTVDNMDFCMSGDTDNYSPLWLSGSHVQLTSKGESFFRMDRNPPDLPAILVQSGSTLTIVGGTITAWGAPGKPAFDIGSATDNCHVYIKPAEGKTLETRVSAASGSDWGNATLLHTATSPSTYTYTDANRYAQIREVSLTVSANPSGSVPVNTPVTLTATPQNIASPTYQWYSNNHASTLYGTIIPHAQSSTYAPPTTTAGNNYYYCVANNTTTSNCVTVTVTAPTPVVITDPTAPKTVPVTLGSPTTLSVTATGATAYQWYYKPNGSASFAPINTATGASCTTPPVTPANIGDQYYCVVTGNGGTATSPIFTLQIAAPGGDVGGDVGADVPKTGDNAHPWLWAGLVALAGAGLALRRRRQRG